jgi:parvulin-like peptidyl-prolyl isomerase
MIRFRSTTIQIDEVLSFLKQTLQLKQICNHLLHQRIVHQIAHKIGIQVSIEEIRAEIDRVRYDHRLFQAADIFAWLTDQLVTVEEWEDGIRDRILTQKLSQHLFSTEVERFFIEHQLEFDQVVLYQIAVPYEQLAREIAYEITEGEISFYEAAHIYNLDFQRRCFCGYEGKVYRRSLHPELSSLIFSAKPGDVIGPVTFDQISHLFMVEEFIPAELTPECHQEILDRLFQEWIATEANYLFSPTPESNGA